MKLKSILKEYANEKIYVDTIQFLVIIKIDSNYCKFQFIPTNSNQSDRLNLKGKENVSKKIKSFLENKLAMRVSTGNSQDAGISFISSNSEIEGHILLMLK